MPPCPLPPSPRRRPNALWLRATFSSRFNLQCMTMQSRSGGEGGELLSWGEMKQVSISGRVELPGNRDVCLWPLLSWTNPAEVNVDRKLQEEAGRGLLLFWTFQDFLSCLKADDGKVMIVFLYIYPSRTGGKHARKHTSGPPYYFEYESLCFFFFLSMQEFTTVPISSNSAHYSKAKGQVWKERIPRATQQQHAIPSSEDSTKNVGRDC